MSNQYGGSGSGSSSSLTRECIECIRSLFSSSEFGLNCVSDRDLCEIFNDGEVLCSILTELSRNRATPEVAVSASSFYSLNSQLLAKQNVRLFLRQCVDVFGLSEGDLFQPEDLLGLRNPERVVRTVHCLLKQRSGAKEAARSQDGELIQVVQEICDHEQRLIDKLMKLLLIRKELLGMLSEWSEDLVHTVFKHTEQLYFVHKEFHAKLTSLASHGCQHFCQHLSAAFVEICPRLGIYFQYFSHLSTANARMDEALSNSPELQNQLNLLQTVIAGTNTFRGLYDAPIRQVTNYQLLFTRLAKAAAKEAPEAKQSVDRALGELTALLDKANAYKRQAEQTDATEAVLVNIGGLPQTLAKPAEVGLHLADGSFKVRHLLASGRKEGRDFGYCVLTTKHLLVAAKAGKREPLNFWLDVPITSGLRAARLDAATLEISLETGAALKLEAAQKRGQDADKWIQLIDGARTECYPEGWNSEGHRFELTSFPAGTDCSICRTVLNGSALQGYLCSQCNSRVDLNCLRQRVGSCQRRVEPMRQQQSFWSRPTTAAASCCRYFHAELDRKGAEALLINKQAGSFLIRKKSGSAGEKVMSVRIPNATSPVIHLEIEENNGRFTLGRTKRCHFPSLDEMISYYRRTNLSDHFNNVNCNLTIGIEPLP